MTYKTTNQGGRKRRPWDKEGIVTQAEQESGATTTKTAREKPTKTRPKQSNKPRKKKSGAFGSSYLK